MKFSVDPLAVQFHLVHDCVRACIYADHLGRKKDLKEAWLSIADMCYSDVVLTWNAVFGSNSQESHWKRLVDRIPIPSRAQIRPFGKDLIVEYLNITEQEWDDYHFRMIDFRNKRLAHFDHGVIRDNFPKTIWALHSAFLFREWLLGLLKAHQDAGQKIQITETTGNQMLAIFRSQIEEVCP